MQALIDDDKLKQVLKEALVEAIEEKRNIIKDLILEAMEDIALVRAIQNEENSSTISKKKICDILEG
ncbi:MAG: hypothetical protein V1844_21370 [Pseudomonadota bacterium]